MEPEFETLYSSAACNRTSNSLDWADDRICYAANNSIMVCRPGKTHEAWKVERQIVCHKSRVNTCKFLNSSDRIVSGGDDALVVVSSEQGSLELRGHEAGVTLVDGMGDTIVSSGGDNKIKVWRGAECLQTIDLRNQYCLALKLFRFQDETWLAYSTDDCKIVLAVLEEGLFVSKLALPGHEDWVLSLDFIEHKDSLFLASGSQDTFIRIWRIFRSQDPLLPVSGRLNVEQEDRTLHLQSGSYAVTLDSVLQGHEGWVTGVHWNAESSEGLRLLSASVDRTLIVWAPDAEEGVWEEKIRTGEVGGNTFGFFGAKFGNSGRSIIGHGYYGSLHRWDQEGDSDLLWQPAIVVGGHFGGVVDVQWEPQGKFLLSVSVDQTTRIHGPWGRDERSWHEIARPQIHGYDMHCIAPLSRYRFASGADEKIVRVFDVPWNFVENLRAICEVEDSFDGVSKGASRPALGLSNKAVNENIEVKNGEYPDHYFVETRLTEPPVEETLLQNTLWPETQKLYGHEGYEVFSLAASGDGKVLASACKASSADHAQVLIWDCQSWKVTQKLASHQLTVTQMEFSPNDSYLLTVSRDRRWTLFERTPAGFQVLSTTDKSNGIHARIIWCCSWTQDSEHFATGSRDGKVAVWRPGREVHSEATFDAKEDVTAMSFAPGKAADSSYVLAIGLGTGLIGVLKVTLGQENAFERLLEIQAHHATVKRLRFRPRSEQNELASCGEDHFVKIFRVRLPFGIRLIQ